MLFLLGAAGFRPAAPVFAEASSAGVYVQELIDRAESAGLAERSEWLALGHYEAARGKGVESLARGERFFLSPDGRQDPRAELRATLEAFFDPARSLRDGEHPQCAFPARLRFLSRELAIDSRRLPDVTCDRYLRWRTGLDARGLTLVFPEAYMNNPASMFGHTLLRVDPATVAEDRDLLAYAVNFAADTGGDGGVAFAFKGIFGGYDGFFSVLPYYQKLKQYGDWENRDIWEYELELESEELDTLLAHVWELLGVPFQYFFFDDNCSYQLLALLEVARPSLRLRREFPLWAIPIDTVRVTAEETDLIRAVAYRPSPATKIRHHAASESAAGRKLARDLALGRSEPDNAELASWPPEHRSAVLSLAYSYLRYLYLAHDVSKEESAPRSRRLLAELSRVDSAAAVAEPPRPRVRPDEGHAAARIGFGGGVRDDEGFVELSLRPVFHALSDPPAGYAGGANLEIGRTVLRYEPERGRLRLEELALVDVTSITPRDTFLKPVSWSFATGWRTRMLSDGSGDGVDPHGVAFLAGGAGLAHEWRENVLAYGLARGVVEAGKGLDDDYALAPGAEVGLFVGWPKERGQSRLALLAHRYVAGDTTTSLRLAGENVFALSARAAVVLEVAAERAYGETWWSAGLSWRHYFRREWDRS